MKKELNILQAVYLYSAGIKNFDFKQVREFIRDNFGDLKVCLVRLKEDLVKTRGLMLDFLATENAFEASGGLKPPGACHILLTDKLFATFDAANRPHIRASIYSYFCVISTSGIVEGPAKPREYYLYKQKYTPLGAWDIRERAVKKKFKGRFIDYRDRRLDEVLKGYIAQSLFFYITGEPFCRQRNCRLFNAHWQEDLIFAQIKSKKFCAMHRKLLSQIKETV